MKKLSLKKLELKASEMLYRNQMKTIYGGYDPDCADQCVSDSDCPRDSKCVLFRDGSCGNSYRVCM